MSYLALYRAFRPKTFDEIIGQEHIVRTLVNQIKTDKVGHAYLFCGARGTGKTTAAKVFARAINCLSPVNGSPCGECEVCKKLENSTNLDVLEMDAASNNKVENVRDIRDKIQYPPVAGRYKVYIIDEVHMLTTEAFNALLKTLEEPPAHAVFILATTEVHKLPATILSRCLRFDFKLIPTATIASLISGIYDKIGKKYTAEAINAIAAAGEGSVRDALSIADVCVSFSDQTLSYDDVIEVLGTSDRKKIEVLVSEIIDGNTGGILSAVDELCMHGKSVSVLNRDLCSAIRDLLVIKTCKEPRAILGLPQDKFNELKALAEKSDVHALLRYLELFSAVETELKYSTHPRIVFETAAVKAGMPSADYNIDALLARISALEKTLNEIAQRPAVLPLTEEFPPRVSSNSTKPAEQTAKVTEKSDIKPQAATVKKETVETVAAVREESKPSPEAAEKPKKQPKQEVLSGFEAAADEFIPPDEDGGFILPSDFDMPKAKKQSETAVNTAPKTAISAPSKPSVAPAASPDAERAWGAILRAMRKDKEIMLWAACEDVAVSSSGSTFCIFASGENEYTFLSKPENADKLKNYVLGEGFADLKITTGGSDEPVATSSSDEVDAVKELFNGEKLTIKD